MDYHPIQKYGDSSWHTIYFQYILSYAEDQIVFNIPDMVSQKPHILLILLIWEHPKVDEKKKKFCCV